MTHDPIQPYEEYRLNWMIEHGYSLPRLIRELARLQEECPNDMTIEELWDLWEDEYGFNGELWVCFDEWKQYEGSEECDG